MGLTFKENCPDIRNSKVVDLIRHLHTYGITPVAVDPWVSPHEVSKELDITLLSLPELEGMDCIVFAVAHDEFKGIDAKKLDKLFCACPNDEKVIIDVKSMLCKDDIQGQGYRYWRL